MVQQELMLYGMNNKIYKIESLQNKTEILIYN